jgi:hypothetical protein
MTEIEQYAVTLVADGAESLAEDDIDEDGDFADRRDWVEAAELGVSMARAIKDNPDEFLDWYWRVAG